MSEPPAYTGYLFPGRENLRHDIYPTISAAQTPSLKQPGKVALITGAGRGIGRATALQYARADVAAIILCARTASQLDEVQSEVHKINDSIRVHKFSLDVTEDAAVAHCAEEVKKTEGRLDVLVPISKGDPKRYWGSITVNVKGPYLFLHAFLPLLQITARKFNTITTVINMTSIGAHTVYPGLSEYSIGKVALNTLTQFVDAEYRDQGIQAFALHPGGIDTDMARSDETFIKGLDGLLIDTVELPGGFCVWLSAADRKWLSGRYLAAPWDVESIEQMQDDIVAGDKLKARLVL
ncbi:putative oxidoreductase ucpA [Karstenula rhodostoma CBS 690.94]|uniref:Oxidoreductase ucpA n=1 Tax=Karstenula rhodostoma CBS 690.94 TaxID=1392251 RepID=A0A9P4PDD4_9PLEO|nr:putative oxidoreductase ucpA [Karstenula rhodostoma CBS 690.94]